MSSDSISMGERTSHVWVCEIPSAQGGSFTYHSFSNHYPPTTVIRSNEKLFLVGIKISSQKEQSTYKTKRYSFQRSLLFCEPICRHPSAAIAVVVWANYCYCCSCWRHYRCQHLHFSPPSFVFTTRLRQLTHHRYRKQNCRSPVEAIATNETTPFQSLERTFESF